MNDATIKMLVAEAVRLDREIEGAKTRLKEIKAELINAACKREDAERVATEGGGWSWTAQGADGAIARVTVPGPALRSTIDPATKVGAKILARFGDAVKRLFVKRVVYVPVPEFRALVEQEFAPAQASKLIESCEQDRQPSVSFETAERAAGKAVNQ